MGASLLNIVVGSLIFLFVQNIQAKWEPCDGPAAPAPVPVFKLGEKTLYVQSRGLVYLSVDSGRTWNMKKDDYSREFSAMWMTHGKYLFAIKPGWTTRSYPGSPWLSDGQLYSSTINDTGWKRVELPSSLSISNHAVLVRNDTLYCSFENGIYRSGDDGRHWSPLAMMPLSNFSITDMCAGDRGLYIVIGASGNAVYRCGYADSVWRKLNLPSPTFSDAGPLAVTARHGFVFINCQNGLWRLNEGTYGIEKVGSDLPVGTLISSDAGCGDTVWAKTTSMVFRSTNAGTTWGFAGGGVIDTNVWSIVQVGRSVIIAANNGIFRSENGDAQWLKTIEGKSCKNPRIIYASGDTLYSSMDAGYPYQTQRSCDGGRTFAPFSIIADGVEYRSFLAMASEGNEWFALSDNSVFYEPTRPYTISGPTGLLRSVDGGKSWKFISALSAWKYQYLWFKNGVLSAASGDGIFRSLDHGSTWIPGTSVVPDSANSQLRFRACTIIGNVLYAVIDGKGLYRSNDAGATWQQIRIGLCDKFISSFAATGDTLLVGVSKPTDWNLPADDDGVYFSTDRGEHWVKKLSGLANPKVVALAVLNKEVYVTTLNGIYKSGDLGGVWQDCSQGLPESAQNMLVSNGTYLFASTPYHGIWRNEFALGTMSKTVSATPVQKIDGDLSVKDLIVSGGILHAGFSLPNAAMVSLRITDLKGRTVFSLVNNKFQAGRQDISLAVPGLVRGAYIATLTSDGHIAKKMFSTVR